MTFTEEMESRFGSDAALGVTFLTDDGDALSLAQYESLMARLGVADMPGCQSLLPSGTSAVCCTNYALLIQAELPGRVRVVGFANEDNPTSRVALEEIHPEGHDFAVVDGRYIVDPWIRLVAAESGKIVFDLQDQADAHLAKAIYGPQSCWTDMQDC